MTLEDFKSKLISLVKNCYTANVILSVYPLFQQANIIRLGGADLTTMTSFIDGKRADIDVIEGLVNALTDTSLMDDMTADTDAGRSAYVAAEMPSLTTDEQKLYVGYVLMCLKQEI